MKFAELLCRTNFSFLRGASHPEELVARAAELGLAAIAIADRDGVYGMPKAYRESKKHPGLKLIVGAELTLQGHTPITLLARDRAAYGALCRLITASHADKPKGEASLEWERFLELATTLPGARGLIAIPEPQAPHSPQASAARHGPLKDAFGDRLYLPLARWLDGRDAERTESAKWLSRRFGIPIVATSHAHYHVPERRVLQDVVTAIREGVTLERAGRKLYSNAERYLKSPREMAELFRDMPQAVALTAEIAQSFVFSPSELRYRYPSEWIPAGETAQAYLERLTWEGAKRRYPEGIPAAVEAQLKHEFKLIHELQFEDYFLTIWEIVEFARSRKILCQGRGSAANSAVCFCLGITAVDPVRMSLLFERFLSAERGEPPDIDVDFEHERREEVLQHVYEKYGRDRAAMVANVIRYRDRLSIREVAKVASGSPLSAETQQALADELQGFPRHLSIHSGGFTLSADALIETVPVEPARMEGRTVVQWDKDDLDAIGLLKVDLLSLGMLTAIRKTLDLVGKYELATIPADDPKTYDMICRADTVGVFQIESRAQMSMLPRLKPRKFYDLVVQVAIVRPGPISGGMVHPYLRRRKGLEPPEYPHPALKPILEKTLGVPIFQEQVMKMAVALAGFTPGEADELRRAIGAWRSSGSIEKVGKRLMEGLLRSGLKQEYVDRIFKQIQGFAEYGFPESHSASFALLAYASSYLKAHHPAELACALINSQPMGFYSVHTIVDDAKRHGVRVQPVHPNLSEWDCVMERGVLRMGLRVVHGLSRTEADAWVAERAKRPFASLTDFLDRVRIRPSVLHALALGDAFTCFGLDQRHALWAILAHNGKPDLLATAASNTGAPSPAPQLELFAPMDSYEAMRADYDVYGMSARGHPMAMLRAKNPKLPRATSRDVRALKAGAQARVAGMVIVRQRPPTAKGTTFATLEDEHGFVDLILHAEIAEKYRQHFLENSFLIAQGTVQRDGQAVSMLVRRMEPAWIATGASPARHPRDAVPNLPVTEHYFGGKQKNPE